MQWGVLMADAVASDRFWPIFAAGFQLLAIVTFGARMLDDSVGAWAYATAGVIWTYLGLFALTFGVVGCWRDHALASKRARRTEEFARHIALNDA